MPKSSFIKTLWGCPDVLTNDPVKWDGLFERIKKDGFDGVEFKVRRADVHTPERGTHARVTGSFCVCASRYRGLSRLLGLHVSRHIDTDTTLCTPNPALSPHAHAPQGLAIPADKAAAWRAALTKAGLIFISQLHTCNYVPREGLPDAYDNFNNQGVVGSEDLSEHIASFREQVYHAKELGAVLCNSHSGHDSWSLDTMVAFMDAAVAIEEEAGITVSHETHRRRILYTPWNCRDVLLRCPKVKVTADLSHWMVVMERCPSPVTDSTWQSILDLVAKRCLLVHARVGYSEGPQVPDPSASECAFELEQHQAYWDAIWKAQAAAGVDVSYIEPEFGPEPYLHSAPHSKERVADLWEVNTWIASRLATRYCSMFGGEVRIRDCADTKPKAGYGDCPVDGPLPTASSAQTSTELMMGVGVLAALVVGAFALGVRAGRSS